MSRNRWTTQDEFDVPLTPLIDIIFILIVFFLVATTFYSEERDLDIALPEGSEGDMITQEDEVYVINIREGGAVVVGSRLLSMDELENELQTVGKSENPRVEIRGDTHARHGRIMAILNLCKKTGISEYALTQRVVREVE